MTILYSLAAVCAAYLRGAYVIHVPESLAASVERVLSARGFHRLDAVRRPDGEITVAFVHGPRSEAIRHAMDGRFSALSRGAVHYLTRVYGPRWPELAP